MNTKLFFAVIMISSITLFAKEQVAINFNKLKTYDLVQIASKVLGKNILINTPLTGYVDYISTYPIYKKDVLTILDSVLDSKGFVLVKNDNLLKIVKKEMIPKITEVIVLKNMEVDIIVSILQDILKQKQYKKVLASSNKDSNAIVLFGKKQNIDNIKNLIKKLDENKDQVYVQAKIIEVSELRTKNIGLQYGLSGFNSFGSGLLKFSSLLNGSTANILDNKLLSSYGYDVRNLRSNLSLGAAINLLKQNSALEVVSEPSILCINNKTSTIYVGETRSIKVGTTVTSGGNITNKYLREDIGLKLKVKPRISSNNKVTLQIEAIIEDISGGLSTEPNTIKKEVLTTAIVNNAESVIIGGLIKNKLETIEDKVAFFGDLPILGNLFRNNQNIKDKINLVIIVTPYIVPKTQNLTQIRDKLVQLKSLEDQYTKVFLSKFTKKVIAEKKENEKEKLTNQELHDKRVQEIFGL